MLLSTTHSCSAAALRRDSSHHSVFLSPPSVSALPPIPAVPGAIRHRESQALRWSLRIQSRKTSSQADFTRRGRSVLTWWDGF